MVKLHNDVQLRLNAGISMITEAGFQSAKRHLFASDTIRYNETQHNRFQPDNLHTQFTLNINRASII